MKRSSPVTRIAGSLEQSAGIEQVNRAIAQTGQVIRKCAALVDEAAATATTQSTQGQTGNLSLAVGVFKLAGETDFASGGPIKSMPARSAQPIFAAHRSARTIRQRTHDALRLGVTSTSTEWAEY